MQSKRLYEFGPFCVDPVSRFLLRGGAPVQLTPKAFDILLVFIQNSGHVLDKDELMKAVWPDTVVEENNLTRNISALRKALGESPNEHRYIVTIPGRGYRFVASVNEARDAREELIVRERTRSHLIVKEEETTEQDEVEGKNAFQNALRPTGRNERAANRRLRLAFAGVCVLLVGLSVALFYFWSSNKSKQTVAGAPVKSIAVLPFKPLSADDSDEYLGLGMADSLITELSNIKQIVVRPTSAVRKYGGLEQDPIAAGREQGVDAVLEGSIQRSGERMRVTVRLMNVRDGTALWAYKCDGQCADIFALQDLISEDVAQALTLKLTGEEYKRLTKRYTGSKAAYQSYIKGRYFWNKRTEEGFRKGIEYFEQAIANDPDYALAYAGMADCYNLLSSYYMLPQKETYPKAKAAAIKALEIDNAIAEAHVSLAYVKLNYDWDWAGAEREYKRAIDLSPNYATAHQWYAWQLMLMGRGDEAIRQMRRAQEIDPLSLAINTDLGLQFYYMRQYDQAIVEYRKALEMDPGMVQIHSYLFFAYLYDGRYGEAFEEQGKAITLLGGRPESVAARIEDLAELKKAYAVSGEKGYWQKQLDIAKKDANQTYGPASLAGFYAVLGEKDQAFELLEKAYEERAELMLYLKVDPLFDNLRSDPRFADLARRVGLAG